MKFVLPDRIFDALRWVCMLCLPAIATLVSTVGAIWSIPYAPEIADTVVAVNAALAMMLGISTINYNKEGESNG